MRETPPRSAPPRIPPVGRVNLRSRQLEKSSPSGEKSRKGAHHRREPHLSEQNFARETHPVSRTGGDSEEGFIAEDEIACKKVTSRRVRPEHSYEERRRSLASLALASGTGEDVAALSDISGRWRLALDGSALRVLVFLLLAGLLATWVWIGLNMHSASKETNSSAQISEEELRLLTPSPTLHSLEPEGVEPGGGTASTSASRGEIIAYISGEVTKPGVYPLPSGSRIGDLVEAAGGFSDKADPASLNLAALLEDGSHIHLEALGETHGATAGESGGVTGINKGSSPGSLWQASDGKVNINRADAATLQTLPGIGPSLAQAILSHREEHGPFTSVDQLNEISGIGAATLAKLRDRVSVS